MDSPYHEGEWEAQKRAGEEEMAMRAGRLIQDVIPHGALKFIDKQPMVIVSSRDDERNIWTSILVGQPGFLTAVDERNVNIRVPAIVNSKLDLFWKNVASDRKVGLLFIELATRRRLRVNGVVWAAGENLRIAVEQAYSNCPKYIQRREIKVWAAHHGSNSSMQRRDSLTADAIDCIKNSDTFFVGSSDGMGNMDASHRGGKPGFIQVLDGNTLKIPDYQGNSMFNTLGNFMANPKAGMLFVDFEKGNTLQLTGEVEIVWQGEGAEKSTAGPGRFWKFFVSECIQMDSLIFSQNTVRWRTPTAIPADSFPARSTFQAAIIP